MFKLEENDKNMIATLVGTMVGNYLRLVEEAGFRDRKRAKAFLNIAFDLEPYLDVDSGHISVSRNLKARSAIDVIAIFVTFLKFWEARFVSVSELTEEMIPKSLVRRARSHERLEKHLNFRQGEARQRTSSELGHQIVLAYSVTEDLLTGPSPASSGRMPEKEIRK